MRCVALLWLCGSMMLAPWRAAGAVGCERRVMQAQSFIVCRADALRERVEIAWAGADGRRLGGFDALRKAYTGEGLTLEFAMNAGMFHPDFRAVGLLVVKGKTLAPINRAAGPGNFFMQPNGVFMIDADGARVLATHEFRNHRPRFATQSGPLLVERGMIPNTVAFRPGSTSRHVRN